MSVTKEEKPFSFLIPQNIYLEDLLNVNQNYKNIEGFKKYKLLYLLSLITKGSYANKHFVTNEKENDTSTHKGTCNDQGNIIEEEGRRLYSVLMKSVIHNYHEYLIYLRSAGIINYDNNNYSTGKSIDYNLSKEYQDSVVKTVVWKDQEDLGILYKNLKKCKLEKGFSINVPLDNYIRKMETLITMKTDAADKYTSKLLRRKKINKHQYNYYQSIINNFINDNFSLSKDKQGRVYGKLCKVPRVLRKYLRLDGHEIFHIDLCSSQPVLLMDKINEFKNYIERGKRAGRQKIWEGKKKAQDHLHKTFLGNANAFFPSNFFEEYCQDIKLYEEVTCDASGEGLYAFLMDKIRQPLMDKWREIKEGEIHQLQRIETDERKINRKRNQLEKEEQKVNSLYQDKDEFKENIFFAVFYGAAGNQKKWEWSRIILYQVIEDNFPTIMKLMKCLKHVFYKKLPRDLQGLESNIFIQGVGKRLMTEGIKFGTLHDGIYVTRIDRNDKSLRILKQTLLERLSARNLSCTIKIEKGEEWGKVFINPHGVVFEDNHFKDRESFLKVYRIRKYETSDSRRFVNRDEFVQKHGKPFYFSMEQFQELFYENLPEHNKIYFFN